MTDGRDASEHDDSHAPEPGRSPARSEPSLRLRASDFLQKWLVSFAALIIAAYGLAQYRESNLLAVGLIIWGLGGAALAAGLANNVAAGRSTLTITADELVYRRLGMYVRGGGSIPRSRIDSTGIRALKVGAGYRLVLDVVGRDGSTLQRWRLPAAGMFKVQTEDQEREVLQFLNRHGIACYPSTSVR